MASIFRMSAPFLIWGSFGQIGGLLLCYLSCIAMQNDLIDLSFWCCPNPDRYFRSFWFGRKKLKCWVWRCSMVNHFFLLLIELSHFRPLKSKEIWFVNFSKCLFIFWRSSRRHSMTKLFWILEKRTMLNICNCARSGNSSEM